ncbi:MAG: FkbM family methyltransferase [Desulfobacteraceae bacterium]|jgi:FkbM family methyltransferase
MFHSVVSRLPLTRIKLFLARIAYLFIRIFLRSNHIKSKRDGITYKLDLSEGIDLSIFIMGTYQRHIFDNPFYSIPEDAIIFDIGANMGCMTLQFAKAATAGHVFAFEPTDFAYRKLLNNVDLNLELKPRITPVKQFASDKSMIAPRPFAMASWKTDSFTSKGHPVHGGVERNTGLAPSITIDEFCESNEIIRVDLIKIDTEGHELPALKGAVNILKKQQPVIIFETGRYLMDEQGVHFIEYLVLLETLGYRLYILQRDMEVTRDNHEKIIPRLSTVDIIALPSTVDTP